MMTPEQQAAMDKLIAEVAKVTGPAVGGLKRALIPNESVIRIAKELGMTPQQVFDAAVYTTECCGSCGHRKVDHNACDDGDDRMDIWCSGSDGCGCREVFDESAP